MPPSHRRGCFLEDQRGGLVGLRSAGGSHAVACGAPLSHSSRTAGKAAPARPRRQARQGPQRPEPCNACEGVTRAEQSDLSCQKMTEEEGSEAEEGDGSPPDRNPSSTR